MHTAVDEVTSGIYRLSTYMGEADFTFNQYLINAAQPLLFHCGMRGLFPLISAGLKEVMPLDRLRWISFGHWEADEAGAMNDWLEAAPHAQVAVGTIGCMLSVNDLAVRAPRALEDNEVVDLGGKRARYLATPHVPHCWDAGVVYEETTKTLFCGDLFTRMGSTVQPCRKTIRLHRRWQQKTCLAQLRSRQTQLQRSAVWRPSNRPC